MGDSTNEEVIKKIYTQYFLEYIKRMAGIVEEIKTMFIVYKDENELMQKMYKVLEEEGDKRITFCIGEERLGITIAECAELLGVSKQLMAEIVREQGFPCLKFKRRILINRNKVQDWLDNNAGRKIKY